MENLTTCVPNYTRIYFPYSTITSGGQGSVLACTRTVTVFRMLTYMQTRFRHQNKPSYRYRNKITTVNQLQPNYFINIHLLILRFINISCVITIKLNTLMWKSWKYMPKKLPLFFFLFFLVFDFCRFVHGNHILK